MGTETYFIENEIEKNIIFFVYYITAKIHMILLSGCRKTVANLTAPPPKKIIIKKQQPKPNKFIPMHIKLMEMFSFLFWLEIKNITYHSLNCQKVYNKCLSNIDQKLVVLKILSCDIYFAFEIINLYYFLDQSVF